MPKRKVEDANGAKPSNQSKMDIDGEDSGSDDDASIINVDFEWFDLDPEIDFHGLKTLLRQLLDIDNQLFELSDLSDLLLSQNPRIGSTVKCDGKESDPFAFLTVLDLQANQAKPIVQSLSKYLADRATAAGQPQIASLLAPGSSAHVGLLISERLINMPHQIVPPLYTMLADEIKQTPAFAGITHFLLLSKTYTEVASELDAEPEQGSSKKSKKKSAAAAAPEVFYFHPEDEALQKFALAHTQFEYAKQGDEGASDAKRAFQEAGIKPQGHLIVLEAAKLAAAVKGVGEYLGAE